MDDKGTLDLPRCADARERQTDPASNSDLSESLHRMLARYPQQNHKSCPHFTRRGLPKTVIPQKIILESKAGQNWFQDEEASGRRRPKRRNLLPDIRY